jgi:hypothetical protein
MGWTFTNDPANSVRDRVRILIGDTNPAEPLISDEVLDWIISKEANEILAAARAADVIAARFAREADIAVGDLSVKYSSIATRYFELAESLRQDFLLDAGSPDSIGFPILARRQPRDPLFRLGQFSIEGG